MKPYVINPMKRQKFKVAYEEWGESLIRTRRRGPHHKKQAACIRHDRRARRSADKASLRLHWQDDCDVA